MNNNMHKISHILILCFAMLLSGVTMAIADPDYNEIEQKFLRLDPEDKTEKVDLLQAFQDALDNDPQFQQAINQFLADREALPQAWADLLPTIQATGGVDSRRREVLGTGFPVEHFTDKSYGLSLTQPVFNFQRWVAVSQAVNNVKAAQARYDAAAQELMVRVAQAYFAVLEAVDTLRFTQAEKRANAKQLEQAKQRHKVGLEAITSVYDAQARYDADVAAEIAAQNDLDNNREALREITGHYYTNLAKLDKPLPLVKPTPLNPDAWVRAAETQNYNLLAAHYAAMAARDSIKTTFAAGLPTVNYRLKYDDNQSNNIVIADTHTRDVTTGFEASWTFFQGGRVYSQTKQAKYQYKVRLAEMVQAHRRAVSQTHQTYNTVLAGISKLKADRQAVISAQSSLRSSEESFKVGTRTFVDVLDAQRDLFDVQRQLASDQYEYLNSTLQLKQAIGVLSVNDLAKINDWLGKNNTGNPSYLPEEFRSVSAKPVVKPRAIVKTKQVKPKLTAQLHKAQPSGRHDHDVVKQHAAKKPVEDNKFKSSYKNHNVKNTAHHATKKLTTAHPAKSPLVDGQTKSLKNQQSPNTNPLSGKNNIKAMVASHSHVHSTKIHMVKRQAIASTQAIPVITQNAS
ncbi:MAG: TolC family outer membrane protein [Gammaproteobacteria bacterium]